jgi:hypothetical protein
VLRTHVIDGSRRGAMAAQAALAVDLAVARGQVCPEERVLVGGCPRPPGPADSEERGGCSTFTGNGAAAGCEVEERAAGLVEQSIASTVSSSVKKSREEAGERVGVSAKGKCVSSKMTWREIWTRRVARSRQRYPL